MSVARNHEAMKESIRLIKSKQNLYLIKKSTIRKCDALRPRTILWIFYSPYKYMEVENN